MGRIRTVKPELFTHEELYDLEKETGLPIRIAYTGMFCQADREGRFKWRPRTLKTQVLPFDNLDFSRVLDALATRGFIEKYTINGEEFGRIVKFKAHQFINNKEPESSLPAPEKANDSNSLTREPRVSDTLATREEREVLRKGRERKGIKDCTNPSFKSKALPSKKEDELEDFSEHEKRVLKQKLNHFNIKAKSYESKIAEVIEHYNNLPEKEKSKFYTSALNMREDGVPVPGEGTFEMNLLLIQRYDREFGNQDKLRQTGG